MERTSFSVNSIHFQMARKKILQGQKTPRSILRPRPHTKTIVNANASKRKLFYAFRPSVHTKTMKTLAVNA